MSHLDGTNPDPRALQEFFRFEPGIAVDQGTSVSLQPRILLVEDDPDIARLVALHLNELDLHLAHCDRGDVALERAQNEDWSLLILDLRLPGMDGLEVCRRVREAGLRTPVLMLTSKSTELDRVLGLELGADDYVTKPFSPLELVARVKAILRRTTMDVAPKADTERHLDCGAVVIDSRDHRVTVRGREVELTAREFDLLLHFARQPGRVFRRTELLDEVWGYGHDGYEHTVNSHINRLRSKIEEQPSDPRHIITVWGVGYKFQAMT